MITARLLPPAEWTKVANREPYASTGLPDPDHWMIPVVERDGQIVASCALFDTVHWDGFAVDEAERANPAIFGKLLTFAVETLQQHGVAGVHITVPANQPELESMVERFGFVKAPGTLYILAVPPSKDA